MTLSSCLIMRPHAIGQWKQAPGLTRYFSARVSPETLSAVVPLERIVLETDAPYMAPVPMRGQRNEPAFVAHVCRKLAEVYGVSEAEVSAITDANVARVFGLNG